MATTLPRVTSGTSAAQIGDLLAEHGAVVVEGLATRAVVEAVNAEVEAAVAVADPAMRMHSDVLGTFHGDRTRHVTGLAARSRTFATEVMVHPLLLALCHRFIRPDHDVLGPTFTRPQLNLGHLIVRGPGAEDQLLHRDEDVWMDVPYPRTFELQLATMIAFVDFTRANGATRLVPGSHRWPDRQRHVLQRDPEVGDLEAQTVYAEMPAGSAVVYLGSTLHGGSANSTADQWRRGAHLSFTHGWLRTEENNYLAVPPTIARTLPRECQEILGYPVCGFLGTLDMLDPVELMADGRL